MNDLNNLGEFLYIPSNNDNKIVYKEKIFRSNLSGYWSVEDLGKENYYDSLEKCKIFLMNKDRTKAGAPFGNKKFTKHEFIEIVKKLEFLQKLKKDS